MLLIIVTQRELNAAGLHFEGFACFYQTIRKNTNDRKSKLVKILALQILSVKHRMERGAQTDV